MKDGQANLPAKIHFPTFLIEPILELVRAGERVGIAEGRQVKLARSQRLRVFAEKGTTCVRCGLKATHFELKTAFGAEAPHLNLMAGTVLMTRDHVVPKSKGGPNIVNNQEPMCLPCNALKGSLDDGFIGPVLQGRKAQRRKTRAGRCRRCHGIRLVPTGEPDEVTMSGDIGTPVKPCSCVENKEKR